MRRALANARLLADRAPGAAQGAQGGDSGSIHGDSRPFEPLTFGPRIPDTGTDSLGDQAALQFGHGTEDRKDHLARGRAGVHLLRQGNEVNPEGLEGFEGAELVRNRPGEAVELPNNDRIESPAVRISHKPVQFGP